MKYKLHVNTHNIKWNRNHPDDKRKVLTLKNYKENNYYNQVTLFDKEGNEIMVVKYQPNKPLSCGAEVWIEFTDNNISFEGE